ncbi:hypothetical protein WA158_005491 [Blastocystis sp. Blastoise]
MQDQEEQVVKPQETQQIRSSWSSFFSSVKSDFQELISSVKEDAVSTFIPVKEQTKNAIVKLQESLNSEEPQDKEKVNEIKSDSNIECIEQPEPSSGRSSVTEKAQQKIGSFIAMTKSKFATVFNDEDTINTTDSPSEYVIDVEEKIRLIQSYNTTYTTITDTELPSYNEWLQTIEKPSMFTEGSDLLNSNSIVAHMYKMLVPDIVTETAFWSNYFFHRDQIKQSLFNNTQQKKGTELMSPVDIDLETKKKEAEDLKETEMKVLEQGWDDFDVPQTETKEEEITKENPTSEPVKESNIVEGWDEWE